MEKEKYVNGDTLLSLLYDDRSKPTEKWLYNMRKKKLIPYYKMGGMVCYKVSEVQDSLEQLRVGSILS